MRTILLSVFFGVTSLEIHGIIVASHTATLFSLFIFQRSILRFPSLLVTACPVKKRERNLLHKSHVDEVDGDCFAKLRKACNDEQSL